MTNILEYIMANYTWIMGGAILILLAIIGSYADKTNFGQGKKDDKKIDRDTEDLNAAMPSQEIKVEEPVKEEPISNLDNANTDLPVENEFTADSITLDSENSEPINADTNDKFEKFDKEFNEVVPEKEIINGDLLDEIENLSLEKTREINPSEIPDVDDVELPEIKDLKKEDEDIWKF